MSDRKDLSSIDEYPIVLALTIVLMDYNAYFRVPAALIELLAKVGIQAKTSIFEEDAHVEVPRL